MSTEKGMQRVGDLVKGLVANIPAFTTDFIPPEDIAYTHSIFLQCFMPLRHTPANSRRWHTNNRDASLVIRAGELVNPDKPNHFKECAVTKGQEPDSAAVQAFGRWIKPCP